MSAENPWLHRLCQQLLTYATEAGGPLPLQDGSRAILGLHGLAWHSHPRQRGPESPWFRQTATFKAHQQTGEPLSAEGREFYLVVQWRSLLAKGLLRDPKTANVSAPLRKLAHSAWWCLLPLIEEHDVVMAQLLRRARENYRDNPERAKLMPFWVGFDTELDERRFDAQASALLASRWTDRNTQEGFCERVGDRFTDALTAVTHAQIQRHVGLCAVARHVRGSRCPTCPEIAADRRFLSALVVPALNTPRIRQSLRFLEPAGQQVKDPSILRDNLRWILDSRHRSDGVCRFTASTGAPARFIDFKLLRQRWQELGLPSVFDDLPAPDQIEGPREARRYFVRMVENAVLPEHSYSPRQLFVEAGWGSVEDFAVGYSEYEAITDSALMIQLGRVDQRSAAMVKARLALPVIRRDGRPPRRVVTRRYAPEIGDAVDVHVIRAMSAGHRVHNFYTTPYAVNGDALFPQKRVGKGIIYEDEYFWTLRALNEFANLRSASDEAVYPDARRFCDWANEQDTRLNDRKLFNAAIYNSRLGERLAAITRGELAHLGAFAEREDNLIVAFFVEKRAKKRLTPADWAELLQQLPCRTERGILLRFDELGKKYAFQHGYQAYATSPYYRKFSSKRRAKWKKEGLAV